MQESLHERERIDNEHFRVLTGKVGFVALVLIVAHRVECLPVILDSLQSIPLIGWIMIVTPPAG